MLYMHIIFIYNIKITIYTFKYYIPTYINSMTIYSKNQIYYYTPHLTHSKTQNSIYRIIFLSQKHI